MSGRQHSLSDTPPAERMQQGVGTPSRSVSQRKRYSQGDTPPSKRMRQGMDTPTRKVIEQTVVELSPAVAVSLILDLLSLWLVLLSLCCINNPIQVIVKRKFKPSYTGLPGQ